MVVKLNFMAIYSVNSNNYNLLYQFSLKWGQTKSLQYSYFRFNVLQHLCILVSLTQEDPSWFIKNSDSCLVYLAMWSITLISPDSLLLFNDEQTLHNDIFKITSRTSPVSSKHMSTMPCRDEPHEPSTLTSIWDTSPGKPVPDETSICPFLWRYSFGGILFPL